MGGLSTAQWAKMVVHTEDMHTWSERMHRHVDEKDYHRGWLACERTKVMSRIAWHIARVDPANAPAPVDELAARVSKLTTASNRLVVLIIDVPRPLPDIGEYVVEFAEIVFALATVVVEVARQP